MRITASPNPCLRMSRKTSFSLAMNRGYSDWTRSLSAKMSDGPLNLASCDLCSVPLVVNLISAQDWLIPAQDWCTKLPNRMGRNFGNCSRNRKPCGSRKIKAEYVHVDIVFRNFLRLSRRFEDYA